MTFAFNTVPEDRVSATYSSLSNDACPPAVSKVFCCGPDSSPATRQLTSGGAQLRRELEAVRSELRSVRVRPLAESAAGVLVGRVDDAGAVIEHLRQET
jgi:hypothetical protein